MKTENDSVPDNTVGERKMFEIEIQSNGFDRAIQKFIDELEKFERRPQRELS